jgi:RNA polymerase I-specific transcription initiation factor RRN3
MEIYLKNMLMLEGGAIREFVGHSMLVEVVNMMLELDVSGCNKLRPGMFLIFASPLMFSGFPYRLQLVGMNC